jgi:hypothetical protein
MANSRNESNSGEANDWSVRAKRNDAARRTPSDAVRLPEQESGLYSDCDDGQLQEILTIQERYVEHARGTHMIEALMNPSEEHLAWERYMSAVAHCDVILAEIRSRQKGRRKTIAKKRR